MVSLWDSISDEVQFKKILNLFGGVNQYIAFHHKQLEDYFITTDQPVRYTHLTG
jgi:hypothetical protein